MEIEEFNLPTWRLRSSHVQSSGLEEPPCLETLGSGWEKRLLPKAMDHPVHPVRRQTEMLPQLWIWASGKFPAKSKEMISVPNELLKERRKSSWKLSENLCTLGAHFICLIHSNLLLLSYCVRKLPQCFKKNDCNRNSFFRFRKFFNILANDMKTVTKNIKEIFKEIEENSNC